MIRQKNLLDLVGIFSVSMSLLQLIMLPLRLMGLTIVTVVLMKEPLLNVTSPNTCEAFSAPVTVVPTWLSL